MNNIPFSNHTISDPNELVGRSGLLRKLLLFVDERHDDYNIVGCRRFGKTCLLRTLVTAIKNNPNSKSYPLYTDPKSWNIGFLENGTIGTSNVYRFLLAIFLEDLTLAGLLKEDVLIRDLIVSPVSNRHVFYEKLKLYNSSSIADTFADAIRKFSSLLHKTIVFIFDEYEFLMKKGFSESTGFQTMRKLSSDPYEGRRPFSYVVAGAVTWEQLCSSIGSKELNTIGTHIEFIKPLKYDDFCLFWTQECNKIDDTNVKNNISTNNNLVYKKSGGVPFYANDLGSYLISNDGNYNDDYYVIIDEIFESLTESQKQLLIKIGHSSNNAIKGTDLNHLKKLGLVSPEDNEITIGFLKEYIQNNFPTEIQISPVVEDTSSKKDNIDIEQYEVEEIVEQIERLRIVVNEKSPSDIFTPSHQDPIEFRILRKKCKDEATMDAFSGSLYKLYYEGSDKGERLPNKWSEFSNLTRALRHLYNHRECEPTTMTEEHLLTIVNNGRHPLHDYEFAHMQLTVLQLCRDELSQMLEDNNSKQAATNDSTPTDTNSSTLRGKINGDKNRIIVENHPAYIIDNRMGFAASNSPREYDYADREEVLFELRETTNPRTGLPFSFAINVRPANE